MFETSRTPVLSHIIRQANWIALGHRQSCLPQAGHSECSCWQMNSLPFVKRCRDVASPLDTEGRKEPGEGVEDASGV